MLIHICHYVSLLPFIDSSDILVSDTVIVFFVNSFFFLFNFKVFVFLFINFIRFSYVNIFIIFISVLVILVRSSKLTLYFIQGIFSLYMYDFS